VFKIGLRGFLSNSIAFSMFRMALKVRNLKTMFDGWLVEMGLKA
jgi:hypothetical protein